MEFDYDAAEAAYNAYAKKTNGKSLATGALLPTWSALPRAIQDAWGAAANAVILLGIVRAGKK